MMDLQWIMISMDNTKDNMFFLPLAMETNSQLMIKSPNQLCRWKKVELYAERG